MHDERLRRLRSWAAGRSEPPETLEIGLTASCNIGCAFCWRENPDRAVVREHVSAERFKVLIREAVDMGVRYLRVIGEGESLVRPDAPEILAFAKSTGLKCFLCTNGTLLSEDLLDRMIDWGWDWLHVSLEAPDAAIHDRMVRHPGAFAKMTGSLAYLRDRKRELGRTAPQVNAGMALNKDNFRVAPGMLALAHRLGLHGVYIEPVTVNSPTSAGMKLSPGEAREWLDHREHFRREAEAYGLWTNVEEIDDERILLTNNVHADRFVGIRDTPGAFSETLCFMPFWFLSIRSNGDVGSCGTFTGFNTVNVRESGSLRDVWYGGWYEEFRERMRRGEPLEHCSSCNTGFVQDTLDLRDGLRTSPPAHLDPHGGGG